MNKYQLQQKEKTNAYCTSENKGWGSQEHISTCAASEHSLKIKKVFRGRNCGLQGYTRTKNNIQKSQQFLLQAEEKNTVKKQKRQHL